MTSAWGFRAPAGDAPGQRVFDIKLQGNIVRENCDIAQLAEGTDKAVVLDFRRHSGQQLAGPGTASKRRHTDASAVINSIEIVNPRS